MKTKPSHHPYVGGVFLHTRHGPIYITEGAWTVDGRLSNFWYWRRIRPDGSLGRAACGYGRDWPRIADAKVIVTVKVPS